MTHYFFLLGLTIAVEVAVALVIMPRVLWKTRLGDVVIANLVSHPLATLAVWEIDVPWIAAELAVTALEAMIYRYLSGFSWRKAGLLSLACNAVTAALSFVV